MKSLSVLALLAGVALTTSALADSNLRFLADDEGFVATGAGLDGGNDGAPFSWAEFIQAYMEEDPSNPEHPHLPPLPAGADAIALAFAMSHGNGGVDPDPTIPVIDPELLFAAAGQCSATVSCTGGSNGGSCTVSVTCPLGLMAALDSDGIDPREFPKWPPPYYSEVAAIGLDYPGLPVERPWDLPSNDRSGPPTIIFADCVYDGGTFSPGAQHHGQTCGSDNSWF